MRPGLLSAVIVGLCGAEAKVAVKDINYTPVVPGAEIPADMDGYGNSRIVRYSPDLKFEMTWGSAGPGAGQFHSPHAAVVDRNGRLIVCDRDNDRIQIFDRDGQLLETWKGYTPFGIAQDHEGRIYISDAKRQQVMQLDDAGAVIDAWGAEGTGPGEFKTPHLIACDSKGNIYVAEVGGKRLQKLKRE